MYKELTKKQIAKFQKDYFNILGESINKVSMISYKNINEYLVNDKYILRIRKSWFRK